MKDESGKRGAENGERGAESGKRKNGERKAESGKRKAEKGKRKTEGGKRKAESDALIDDRCRSPKGTKLIAGGGASVSERNPRMRPTTRPTLKGSNNRVGCSTPSGSVGSICPIPGVAACGLTPGY